MASTIKAGMDGKQMKEIAMKSKSKGKNPKNKKQANFTKKVGK